MGEWPWATVADIASQAPAAIAIGPFGSRMKADRYVPAGVPVIRGGNIGQGRGLQGEWVFVSDETADELSAANVRGGDLVFPHRGAIGEVALVPSDRPRYMLSTSLMKLSCDRRLAIPEFLYYFFRSVPGRAALLANTSTVGTPGIGQPLATLRSIRVPLPPIAVQHRITEILGALDDKIELNRRHAGRLDRLRGRSSRGGSSQTRPRPLGQSPLCGPIRRQPVAATAPHGTRAIPGHGEHAHERSVRARGSHAGPRGRSTI